MTAATEILKTGMSTELWGQRFYREAVARTESEDGKKIFESLVEEEGRWQDGGEPGIDDGGHVREHRGDHRDGHEAGDQAVHLLDRLVRRAELDQLALGAVGPVLTAQTRFGQAHRGARHHDQHQEHQGRHRDALVGRGGQGPAEPAEGAQAIRHGPEGTASRST